MQRLLTLICAIACLAVPAAGAARSPGAPAASMEVVVRLAAPPLALAHGARREARARIDTEQAEFMRALRDAIPAARVRWRYRLVLNGVAVVLPREAIGRLRSLPGVRDVQAGVTYRASASPSRRVPAAKRWSPGLPNRGDGLRIAIIDDGVDQTHVYFDPSGYTMPPGFPRGQLAYTTAKVIVARAFAPAGATWKNARKPFDPGNSAHGTHVAGIAAGNAGTPANGGLKVSGVAPRAYIGNYKALAIPTDSGAGLDGNAPELIAAIEAAVADGMDVINMSIGEPEVEPSRDLVALALDAAAAAGVVPVVAAGNDFDDFGAGSVTSPGSSARAITVAAVTTGRDTEPSMVAGFSSAGPTPISLRLKPDVSAPGVGILSSVPGGWESMSGTSMASPHVAGAAALLLERHPGWTVEQVKAALMGSADPVPIAAGSAKPTAPSRVGGGLVNLPRADQPLVLATPASVSFGLVRPGTPSAATVVLGDAGAGLGAGTWSAAVETQRAPAGAVLDVPPTVEVPGVLTLTPVVATTTGEGDLTGWVTLTRGTDVRRIPFWLRVERPALERKSFGTLGLPGLYSGDTRGKTALVTTYRYPEVRPGVGISARLRGPEQVFRVTLAADAANFGVVVTQRSRGVSVEPRVTVAGDENRLTGYPALPENLNPYLEEFGDPVLAAGAVRPLAGSYDVVFDSPAVNGAGAFSFRYWLNDVKPPAVTLLEREVRLGQPLHARLTDAGSGVDAATIHVKIDADEQRARLRDGILSISTAGLLPGTHRLRLQVSDYQESRNMENVAAILPNTRVLAVTFAVR